MNSTKIELMGFSIQTSTVKIIKVLHFHINKNPSPEFNKFQ